MECEFCTKKYSNRSNLKYHQRSSKTCLIIQGKEIMATTMKCCFCEKQYTNKKTLNVHTMKCKKSNDIMLQAKIHDLEKEVRKKDEELKIKDNAIKEIAMKSVSAPKITNTVIKNTTTTNNNNKYEFLLPFSLTSEYIKSKVNESFTEEYFLNGQRGVANFTYNNLLKDESSGKQNYYCTDLSRKVFVYKKEKEGKIIKDYKSNSLTNMIAGDIINKSQCIYKDGLLRINDGEDEGCSINNKSLFRKKMVYLNNLCDIESLKENNEGFVRVLCGLVCNNENNDEELVYVIESSSEEGGCEWSEEEEEEEEDLSKYTKEYFDNKEAMIEREFRDSGMYKSFRRQFEVEKAKYLI